MERKCENRTSYFRYFMAENCEMIPGAWGVYLRNELRTHRSESRQGDGEGTTIPISEQADIMGKSGSILLGTL